jgi:hypothetical protein
VVGELLLPIETEHKSHQLTVKRHHTTYRYSEKEQKSQDVCHCKKHPFEGKLITSTRAERPADITPNAFPASKVGAPH